MAPDATGHEFEVVRVRDQHSDAERRTTRCLSTAASRGLEDFEPISFTTYAEYGEWFQQKLVPDVEQVRVTGVSHANGVFSVTTETGERLEAKRVIVATGLGYFRRIPDLLASLPRNSSRTDGTSPTT